jgi:uncharacterized protein (DUF1330 family)
MNYLIVLFKNKVKQRIIKKYKTSKNASDFYNSLVEKNQDVIFETKHENGKPVDYELALLEKKGNTLFPIYTKDEFGRNIRINFEDSDYNIVKINPYKEPELIQDYQTKNKININTFINKYLSKDGIKLVSKLNNKIIVQNEEVINLFTLKNESDAHRLIENLTERFVRLKRGDCMFVLDISSPQRKYLYTLLKEKGFNLDYLYRKETTY